MWYQINGKQNEAYVFVKVNYNIMFFLFAMIANVLVYKVEDIYSSIVVFSVPDEGYSRHTSCSLNLMSTLLLIFKVIQCSKTLFSVLLPNGNNKFTESEWLLPQK